MTKPTPRDAGQRKADTLALLNTPAIDVWVATASATGAEPYLVPVSLAWFGERAVIAVDRNSRTARNLAANETARLAVGPTRDVVVIDAELEQLVPVGDAPAALADGYAAQADWDPRTDGDGNVYAVLRPKRIQAWRESNELAGRTLMRDGTWLV